MLDIVSNQRSTAKPSIAQINSVQADRELSWFSERVRKGKAGVFSEVATITPQIAAHILECNPENRPVRQGRVSEIAADIMAGRWDLNGEAIKVATTGELNDGQHRLHAIVLAKKEARTVVIFGLPRDSRFTVDMGNARSVADFLGMEGGTYCTSASSAARLHNLYRRGLYHRRSTKDGLAIVTKQEIRGEFWRFEKQFGRALADLVNDPFVRKHALTSALTAHVILTRRNSEAAAIFFQRLCDGTNLKPGDAILALRARLMATRGDKLQVNEKLEMILRYWNAWRNGVKVSRALRQEGCYPKVEG